MTIDELIETLQALKSEAKFKGNTEVFVVDEDETLATSMHREQWELDENKEVYFDPYSSIAVNW